MTQTTQTPQAPWTSETSDIRMSNSGYHRCGKPNWWARVGDRFLDIGQQRGDDYLEISREIIESLRTDERVTVHYGCGPKWSKDCRRGSFTINPKEA